MRRAGDSVNPFAKYVIRGLKKRPTQPIIIIITLVCAIVTMISSAEIIIGIRNELFENHNAWYDIEVRLSSGSDVRVLFADDTKKVVGEDGEVIGEFSLSGLYNTDSEKSIINLSATDLTAADKFRPFKFTEYGRITEQTLNKSVILSSEAAREYNLTVGDKINIHMLGERFEFTVEAIALSDGLLQNRTGVINIGADTEALAAVNPTIAAFADSITPYTSLKVRVNDPEQISEIKDRISNITSLNRATVITAKEDYESDRFVSLTSFAIITVTTVVVMLLSVMVIASAFDILNKKRRGERALFMICGASPANLRRVSATELFMYGSAAMIISIPASLPMLRAFNRIFGYSGSSLHISAIFVSLLGCLIMLSAVVLFESYASKGLSVLDLLSDTGLTDEKKIPGKLPLVLLSALVIGFITIIILPTRLKFVPSIISCALFLALMYFGLPFVLKLISLVTVRLLFGASRIPTSFALACKGLYFSYPIMHTARLVTLLTTIVLSIVICINTLTAQIDTIEQLVECDYIAVATDKDTEGLLENIEGVDAFYVSFNQDLMTEADTGLLALSVSDEGFEHINQSLRPTKNPRGNEIAVSVGVADLCDKKIGDSISLTYETGTYTFTIVNIINTPANFVCFDAEYLGLRNDLLCISTATADNEIFNDIANLVESRGASVVTSSEIFSKLTKRLHSYAEIIDISVIIAIITSVFGIANVLLSSLTSRKREREILYAVGMTERTIVKTALIEILVCTAAATVLAFALLPIMIWLFDCSVGAWGIDLI